MKGYLFLVAALFCSSFGFEHLKDGDYHVDKGYRTCIACHVYRGNPGVDDIISCNNNLQQDVNFRNFPATANAGENLQAIIDFVSLGKHQKPNIILVETNSHLNIKDYGWEVVQDPKATNFNYVIEDVKDSTKSDFTMTFQLKAPAIPGAYDIEAGLHGSGCFKPYKNIYIREDHKTIIVSAVAETTAPTIQLSAGIYAKQIAVRFSEPIHPAEGQDITNYTLTNTRDNSTVTITSAGLSDDGKTLLLWTQDLLNNGDSYNLVIQNVKDYAQTPNVIAPGSSTSFTVNRLASLTLESEIGMDGTNAGPRMLRPQLHFLGHISDNNGVQTIHKSNLLWDISAIPPGETIKSAKLVFVQSDSSNIGAAADWQIFRLMDTALIHWNLVYGNTALWWTGLNQGPQPISTLSHDVQASIDGVPGITWEWDVTTDFQQAYAQGTAKYAIRIMLNNATANVRGVKLYSGFHEDRDKTPKLVVELDNTTSGSGSSIHSKLSASNFSVIKTNTVYDFRIPGLEESSINLKILDLKGNLIYKNEYISNGLIRWTGINLNGNSVNSGIYVYSIEVRGQKILNTFPHY